MTPALRNNQTKGKLEFKLKMPANQFFAIIFKDTLATNKLVLPEKFTTLQGHKLSEFVTLVLPCGSKWQIGLEKTRGKIRFERGWAEFSMHYSLKLGHLLVFDFVGNSTFKVSIFDSTTCEIDSYPVVAGERGETSKKKGKAPRLEGVGRSKEDILWATRPIGQLNKDKYLATASEFNPKKPHFKVVMQPSYVTKSRMSVPTNFAKLYLQVNCGVRLTTGSGERFWTMKYSNGLYNPNQRYKTAKFHSGWKSFVGDNDLDIGNVCVFVLINNRDPVSFHVRIFRTKETNSNPSNESLGNEGGDSDSDSDSGDESGTDSDYYYEDSSFEEE